MGGGQVEQMQFELSVTFASVLHVEQIEQGAVLSIRHLQKKLMLRLPNFSRIVAGFGND
jgi:hypothetical protein